MKPHFLRLFLVLFFALPLRAETIYSGRVLLPDGKPAVGVEVALSVRSNVATDERGELPKAAPATIAKTDGSGNWQLKGPNLVKWVAGSGTLPTGYTSALLVAFSPQHTLVWRNISIEDKAPFVLKMKPADTRHLMVRDEAGKGITGAKVRLSWLYARLQDNTEDERSYLSLPEDLAMRWAHPTGTDGSLKLSFLPANMQTTFLVEAAGYATVGFNEYQSAERIIVTLPRPISLKLRLVAPPNCPLPIAGQSLSGYIKGAQQYSYYEVKSQITDANGEITLNNIGPGAATFTLFNKKDNSSGYFGEIEGKFKISAPEKRSVIELPLRAIRTHLVRGKVTSPDGKPIKGAAIYGTGPGYPNDMPLATTNEQGEYSYQAGEGLNSVRVLSAPAGYATPAGYNPQKFTVEAETNTDAVAAPDFVLQKATPFKVLVLDTQGKPKPKAQVLLSTRDEFFFYGSRRTDTKGTLDFPNLGDGQITVAARDGDAFSERKILKPPFPPLLTLRLKNNAGAKLKGRVLNQYNQPVAGAKVQIVEARERTSGIQTTLTTDKNGYWQSKAFWPDAKFSLFVQAPRHIAAKSAAWQGMAGQTHDFGVLKLTRLDGFVTGIVQDEHGKPQAGAHIWVRGGNSDNLSSKNSSIVTDKSGKFRVDGLSNNALLVFAEKNNNVGAAWREKQKAQKSDVKIILGRYHGSSPNTTTEKARLEAGRRIALSHVDECIKQLQTRNDKAATQSLASLLSALARVDSRRAANISLNGANGNSTSDNSSDERAQIESARVVMTSAEQLLQKNPPDVTGALAHWNGIKDPMFRVYSMITAARKISKKYPQQARQLIAPALAASRSVPEVSYRTIMLAKLGSVMNNLDPKSGDALLQEATTTAKSLGSDDYAGFARACVAEEIVATDPETALDLIKDVKDANEKSRYYGKVSYRLAARDPQRAIKLARDNLDEWNQGRALAGLCHALALTDLPKAEALADSLKNENRQRAYRWMIEVLAPTRRSEAQRLWRKATGEPSSKYAEEYERQQNAVEEIMLIAAGHSLGLKETVSKTLESFGQSPAREVSYWSSGDDYGNRQEFGYGLAVYLAEPNLGRDFLRSLVEASLPQLKQAKEFPYYAGPTIIAAVLSDPKLADELLRTVPKNQQAAYLTSLLNFVGKSETERTANINQLLMLGQPYDDD